MIRSNYVVYLSNFVYAYSKNNFYTTVYDKYIPKVCAVVGTLPPSCAFTLVAPVYGGDTFLLFSEVMVKVVSIQYKLI